VSDQHAEPPGREPPAVEVAQIELVEPGQVGLYRIAVLIEQGKEAG
jgi:hypothetical protein